MKMLDHAGSGLFRGKPQMHTRASLRFGGVPQVSFAPELLEKHIIPILVPPIPVGS